MTFLFEYLVGLERRGTGWIKLDILTKPWVILKKKTMSRYSCQNVTGSMCSAISLSLYETEEQNGNFNIYLVARLCVCSILQISSTDCGAQIWVAYPNRGLTKVRYINLRTSMDWMYLVFLFMYPSSLLAREVCSSTCLFHVRLLEMITPRSRSDKTTCKGLPLILYDDSVGLIFLVMIWCLHLLLLNTRPESDAHVSKRFRSACKESASAGPLIQTEKPNENVAKCCTRNPKFKLV